MAKSILCDLCGGENATSGILEKRVALPKALEFPETRTKATLARVQIHVYAEDGRLTIPDLCPDCRASLANAEPFVPKPKADAPPENPA